MLGLVVSLAIFAVVIYAGFWVMDRRRNGSGNASNEVGRLPPSGPVGPDDDEDFLRELKREKRHRKDEQSKDDES